MENFNFNAPAELFPSRNRKVVSKLKYRRFDKAAEAKLPPLTGTPATVE